MADQERNKNLVQGGDGEKSPSNEGAQPSNNGAAPTFDGRSTPSSNNTPGQSAGLPANQTPANQGGMSNPTSTPRPVDTDGVPRTPLGGSAASASPTSGQSGGATTPTSSPGNSPAPVNQTGAPDQSPGAFNPQAIGQPLGQNGGAPASSSPQSGSPQEASPAGAAASDGNGGTSGSGSKGSGADKNSENSTAGGQDKESGPANNNGDDGGHGGLAAARGATQGARSAGAKGGEAAAQAGKVAAQAASRAAMAVLASPAGWIAIGVTLLLLVIGIVLFVVIVGIAGSGTGQGSSSKPTGSTGGTVSESGKELREAFLKQKNITYQKSIIQTEIRDGSVDEKVLKAVLAAARSKGAGTLAVSAAGCRSHSASGGHHCPQTPSTALDIGSAGTSNANAINEFLCDSVKNGNPYKLDELFGIISPNGCVVNGGKPGGGNPDPPNHLHVATT